MRDDLTAWVDPGFDKFRPVVTSTIEQIVGIAGWKTKFVDDKNSATLTYSSTRDVSSLLQSAGKHGWISRDQCQPITKGKFVFPSNSAIEETEEFDLVLASNTILSGFPERFPEVAQYALRNIEDHGVPGRRISDWGLSSKPQVNSFVQLIADKFKQNLSLNPTKQRWPNGKTWALCLTHDCDRIQRYRTTSFFRDALKCATSFQFRNTCTNIAKSLYAASVPRKRRIPDPYLLSWKQWIDFETRNNIRATYFIAAWDKYQSGADARDVPYQINDTNLRKVVNNLSETGFQVGLHNSVNAWKNDRYAQECDMFEQALGFAPKIYRGHCWSLDSRNPESTMKRVAESTSLSMSSCLGMNLVHGYRRGINYPYRPFDPNTGEYSGNWEVPPTMMDQSLFLSGDTNQQRIEALHTRLEEVRESNGCFVLDWHTDSLWSGYMGDMSQPVLAELEESINDSSCWATSLGNIIDWCENERWQS